MNYLRTFEEYEYENFTHSDMEFAKELYDEGMTDPADIAREMDWKDMSVETVKQMLDTMKRSGEIGGDNKADCPNCDGDGWIVEGEDCEDCDGSGKILNESLITEKLGSNMFSNLYRKYAKAWREADKEYKSGGRNWGEHRRAKENFNEVKSFITKLNSEGIDLFSFTDDDIEVVTSILNPADKLKLRRAPYNSNSYIAFAFKKTGDTLHPVGWFIRTQDVHMLGRESWRTTGPRVTRQQVIDAGQVFWVINIEPYGTAPDEDLVKKRSDRRERKEGSFIYTGGNWQGRKGALANFNQGIRNANMKRYAEELVKRVNFKPLLDKIIHVNDLISVKYSSNRGYYHGVKAKGGIKKVEDSPHEIENRKTTFTFSNDIYKPIDISNRNSTTPHIYYQRTLDADQALKKLYIELVRANQSIDRGYEVPKWRHFINLSEDILDKMIEELR